MSWHLTVVHNYIVAFLVLSPYLKIRLSSHCLKTLRIQVFWVQANSVKDSWILFPIVSASGEGEEIWTDTNAENQIVLKTFAEKWYSSTVPSKYLLLLFFFPNLLLSLSLNLDYYNRTLPNNLFLKNFNYRKKLKNYTKNSDIFIKIQQLSIFWHIYSLSLSLPSLRRDTHINIHTCSFRTLWNMWQISCPLQT